MIKYLLTILLLLSTIYNSAAQNKRNEAGQRIGFWSTPIIYYNDSGLVDTAANESGFYKIITKNRHDTVNNSTHYISGDNDGYYEVYYNKVVRTIHFYSKIYNGALSVRNGLWTIRSQDQYIREESYYIDGINIWTREYTDIGTIKKERIFNDNDEIFNTYLDNKLFHTYIVTHKDSFNFTYTSSEHYYPNAPFIIDSTELALYVSYAEQQGDTAGFTITAKDSISLSTLNISTKQYSVWDNNWKQIKLPIQLKKGDFKQFYLIYTPNWENPVNSGKLTLEVNKEQYSIYVKSDAYHISKTSFDKNKKITISKKVKELRIDQKAQLESVADFRLYKDVGEYKSFFEREEVDYATYKSDCGYYYFDLSKYPTGDYIVTVVGHLFTLDAYFTLTD